MHPREALPHSNKIRVVFYDAVGELEVVGGGAALISRGASIDKSPCKKQCASLNVGIRAL